MIRKLLADAFSGRSRPSCYPTLNTKNTHNCVNVRHYLSSQVQTTKSPTMIYDRVSEKTLQYLFDAIDAALEDTGSSKQTFDATLADGVLTLALGPEIGTFVINKQPPNLQLWLSSPLSGPRRFDYVRYKACQNDADRGVDAEACFDGWICHRDKKTRLVGLLSEELSRTFNRKIDLTVDNK